MCQPENQDIEALSDEDKTLYVEEVKSIREFAYDALQEYQKGVLVKLNWTSMQDAAFMTETLACYTSDEIFLQLKASSL
jgi:predicted phosphohydrolase